MKRIRRLFTLALALALCLGLIAPASAYTMNTLVGTKDYFIFEGGIIDTKWTKVISHITEDGALTSDDIISYRPTVYIPLGSKITLTQNALNQGYMIAIAKDGVALEQELTSCIFNYTDEMDVVLYTLDDVNYDGSFYYDFIIYAVGVKDGVAANLLTPFTDISYFGERMDVKGSYNKTFNIALSEELRGDIDWVYTQGLISGTSETTFSPYKYITRAEVAQALWIYSGKPEPKNIDQNPFEGMGKTDPYYKACVWASENELFIIYGTRDYKPNWTASKNQIKLALEKLLNCSLPETIYDGEEHVTGVGGYCSRANAAHLLHYAHKYVKGDTPSIPNTPDTPSTPSTPTFSDVKAGDYYADAVKWAIDKKITKGTSTTTFSPDQTCTNAEILTFIYRAHGEPEPIVANLNPFTNVQTTDYYYKATLWMAERGEIDVETFNPNAPCTRAMAVKYMWAAEDWPDTTVGDNFTDVDIMADYCFAVYWAVEKGITKGTTTTTFSPNDTCTRGQIVTFLHRGLAK